MWRLGIAVLAVSAPIAGGMFIAGRSAPQSFAECYLEQMRGQTADMSPFAASICEKRTGQSLTDAVHQLFPTARP